MVLTKSAFNAYPRLDSARRACDAKDMRQAARARKPWASVWLLLGVAALGLWASLLACRGPRTEDGAGGQSGDEGRRPRLQGVGGGAAEPLQR
jgi:hypothetical protein